MIKRDLTEATGFAQQILSALAMLFPGSPTVASAQLYWNCGYMWVNASNQLNSNPTPFFSNLAACFNQALVAGVTYAQFDGVRVLASGFTPVSPAAIAVCNYATRMALVEQSYVLAATTFTNRQDVDNYITLVYAAFSAAEDLAADNLDNTIYVDLITLKSAVIADLNARGISLPPLVDFTFPRRFPSLYLAQRIYQDGSQSDAIVAENPSVVHPAFMPTMLEVLSPA
jgi:hypothetical protein